MDLMGISDFARLSRLSPRALRLYDELGLLPPASVDPDSGYRWYSAGQLAPARLIAALRGIGMPLAQIRRRPVTSLSRDGRLSGRTPLPASSS